MSLAVNTSLLDRGDTVKQFRMRVVGGSHCNFFPLNSSDVSMGVWRTTVALPGNKAGVLSRTVGIHCPATYLSPCEARALISSQSVAPCRAVKPQPHVEFPPRGCSPRCMPLCRPIDPLDQDRPPSGNLVRGFLPCLHGLSVWPTSAVFPPCLLQWAQTWCPGTCILGFFKSFYGWELHVSPLSIQLRHKKWHPSLSVLLYVFPMSLV